MMNNQKKLASAILILFFSPVLLFFFQNCAENNLERVLASDTYQAPQLKLSSNICNEARAAHSKGSKFIFVLDMSRSNIGELYAKANGTAYPPNYFDKTKGTDYSGLRFDAVEEFLDTCGDQSGDLTSELFAVVAFSNSAGLPTVAANGSKSFSCLDPQFSTAVEVKSQLNALRDIQSADKIYYEQWSESANKPWKAPIPATVLMDKTSYVSGLECAQSLIEKDLTANVDNQSDSYHVFFITDGAPRDPVGSFCRPNSNTLRSAEDACYLSKTNTAVSSMSISAMVKAKEFKLYSLFYGISESSPPILNTMAENGGTTSATQLGSFDGNQSMLCQVMMSNSAIEYRPDSVSGILLTVKREFGALVADSDMDGVSDEKELSLNWDPQNPRSLNVNGVLDGVCLKLGGRAQCQQKRSTLSCDENLRIGIGLTECDYKMLGLDLLPGANDSLLVENNPANKIKGIDSDKDGMIDFVEILKGTNPAEKDMNDDPDKDGQSNLSEIIRGSDPFVYDSSIPNHKLNDIKIYYNEGADRNNECPTGSWQIDVNRLQTTYVQQLPLISGASDLGTSVLLHAQGEHLVLLLYRLNPRNSNIPISEFYYSLMPVQHIITSSSETMVPVSNYVNQSQFTQIGKVRP